MLLLFFSLFEFELKLVLSTLGGAGVQHELRCPARTVLDPDQLRQCGRSIN